MKVIGALHHVETGRMIAQVFSAKMRRTGALLGGHKR